MVGPKLHDDVLDFLIRYRFFKDGMIAYVAKLYRHFDINEKYRYFQRLV